jgi:hypothetical protein
MWLIVSYAGSVVVNNGVLCWASGCETLWVMLSSVCRNHGVLCWASRCESLIVMLNQWLWIMVGYSVLVGLNHGELCWARGWQSCCIILSQCYESLWVMLRESLWIMVCYDCQLWYEHCQRVWILLCYTEVVVGNHDVNAVPVGVNNVEWCWASGCESWCVMLSHWLWIIVNYA